MSCFTIFHFSQLNKKVLKEEKELVKVQAFLSTIMNINNQLSPTSQGVATDVEKHIADSNSKELPSMTEQIGDQNENVTIKDIGVESENNLVLNNQLLAAQREIDQIRLQLLKTITERDKLSICISVETAHSSKTTRWMQKIQHVLWPSNNPDIKQIGAVTASRVGAPVGCAVTSMKTLVGYLSKNPGKEEWDSDKLLSPKMLEITREFVDGNIVAANSVEDVLLVVDAFRWMSWCNICLKILRCPPSTEFLRKLIDCAKPLRVTDDKVLKLLTGILSRAR
jgi:hypothetical protein